MKEIGDRIIWKPIDYRDMSQNTSHPWYGAKGTVIELDTLNRVVIALDDFPNCNYREHKNRFLADYRELESEE